MRRRTPGQRADPSHVAVKPARPYPLAQLPQNPTFSTPLSPARHGTHRREALPVRLELCSPTRATRRRRRSQPAAAARVRDRGRFVAGRRAAATQPMRRAKEAEGWGGAGGEGPGTRRGERRGEEGGGGGRTGDDGELGGVPDGDDAGLVCDGEEADGRQGVLHGAGLVRRRDVCRPRHSTGPRHARHRDRQRRRSAQQRAPGESEAVPGVRGAPRGGPPAMQSEWLLSRTSV